MDKPEQDRLIRRAVARAADRDTFVAGALAAFRSLHGIEEAALAAHLGCSVEALPRLALCRRPDGDSPRFREDVERIAAYTGVDAIGLARLLREVDAVRALHRGSHGGMLMAARDARIAKESPPNSSRADQNRRGERQGEP